MSGGIDKPSSDAETPAFTPSEEDRDIIRRARERIGALANAPQVPKSLQDRVASELGVASAEPAPSARSQPE